MPESIIWMSSMIQMPANGVVTGLNLSERIRKQAAADVADLILATMRKTPAESTVTSQNPSGSRAVTVMPAP